MSLCDNCIHRNVCGNEAAREKIGKASPFLYVCDDFILSVPERKKREWKVSHTDIDEVWATCSNCGEEVRMELNDDGTPTFYNFCPNCGADMRGGE